MFFKDIRLKLIDFAEKSTRRHPGRWRTELPPQTDRLCRKIDLTLHLTFRVELSASN